LTLERGHRTLARRCLLCAITGLLHRSNCVLFDHLAGRLTSSAGTRSGVADGYFPRVLSNTLSTASVMASTPVSMVGFGTGANKGELVARQLQAVALAGRAATRSGS